MRGSLCGWEARVVGITIERLRSWVAVLGVLLVLAIAGFLAYARYKVRQIGHDLPSKLGLEIQQSTNDFTISKSRQGHTLFTLHAAKAVQYKGGGRAVLHDVSIVMYGKDGARADRISGSQFDYDPSTKIVRADGAVDIQLEDSTGSGKVSTLPASARPAIQVRTSGLTFNQETQVASTEEQVTFQRGESSGTARGATYDSGKGTFTLAHDVVLRTSIDGDPVVVQAAGAKYDRDARQLYFIQQHSDYRQRHCSSDQAIIYFRPDNSADHISAEGHLRLTTDDGSSLQATNGVAQLDPNGAVKQIKLDGGLLFISHDPVHSLHMDSSSGTLSFVPQSGSKRSAPNHLQMVGAVSVVDQMLSLPGDPHGSETREARASQLDADLASDSAGRAQVRSVLANGGAAFTMHTIHEKTPQQITSLAGNQIYATLADGHALSSLRAQGDTSLEQSTPGGLDQISKGDSLMVNFAGDAAPLQKSAARRSKAGAAASSAGRALTRSRSNDPGSQIESAVQQGHATLIRTQPATTAGSLPARTTASADRISYDGTKDEIELSGGAPRITQGDDATPAASDLTAPLIDFNRTTGDASATGGVKATYNSPSGGKPLPASGDAGNGAMHVVADRAALDETSGETTFLGGAREDARLWQGASSVTAPKITLSRNRELLTANGPPASVKAAFVETGKPAKQSAGGVATSQTSVVRTSSSLLVYSGGERKVTLSGGVVAEDANGSTHASTIELYLNQSAAPPAGAKPGHASATGPNGKVDRLIAEGNVQFTQGERRATGQKLVYTGDDGHFVLTGTSASAPRVTDPQHGTVSGASLIFNNRDDSVVVSGQAPTTTDTHTMSGHNHPGKTGP